MIDSFVLITFNTPYPPPALIPPSSYNDTVPFHHSLEFPVVTLCHRLVDHANPIPSDTMRSHPPRRPTLHRPQSQMDPPRRNLLLRARLPHLCRRSEHVDPHLRTGHSGYRYVPAAITVPWEHTLMARFRCFWDVRVDLGEYRGHHQGGPEGGVHVDLWVRHFLLSRC